MRSVIYATMCVSYVLVGDVTMNVCVYLYRRCSFMEVLDSLTLLQNRSEGSMDAHAKWSTKAHGEHGCLDPFVEHSWSMRLGVAGGTMCDKKM